MQIPPVVKLLLMANLAIFALQFVFTEALIINMALWPLDLSGISQQVADLPTFKLHQLVTYAFLHGNFLQLKRLLFLNCLCRGTVKLCQSRSISSSRGLRMVSLITPTTSCMKV
jgi:hypothetical protein